METELGGGRFGLEVLDLPAPGKGQDRWSVAEGFVGLADGATPLGNEPASAVGLHAGKVLEALASFRGEPARRMARLAIQATLPLAKTHVPPLSCTAAMARTSKGGIELVVLGDSLAVVEAGGRLRTIRDPRPGKIDQAVVSRLGRLIESGLPADEALRAVSGDLKANRMRMNRSDSFWSFSTQIDAGRHVLYRLYRPDLVDSILLATDGFVRLVDTFHEFRTAAELLRQGRRIGLARLGDRLRELETRDDSLVRYPRFGRHDDATAILLIPI
jgi:hypothetical protein